ncbi:MAG TPA: M23 family peptidase, partial [Bacillaceae bacterium]
MGHRVKDVRRRIAARRRRRYSAGGERQLSKSAAGLYAGNDEENMIFEHDSKGGIHPLWNREVFFLKLLLSAVLVLVTAIAFKSPSAAFDSTRSTIKKAMGQEFQFAAVSEWYEDQFGKPLALLPAKVQESDK